VLCVAVVVHGHRAGADVRPVADLGVAEIGEVLRLRPGRGGPSTRRSCRPAAVIEARSRARRRRLTCGSFQHGGLGARGLTEPSPGEAPCDRRVYRLPMRAPGTCSEDTESGQSTSTSVARGRQVCDVHAAVPPRTTASTAQAGTGSPHRATGVDGGVTFVGSRCEDTVGSARAGGFRQQEPAKTRAAEREQQISLAVAWIRVASGLDDSMTGVRDARPAVAPGRRRRRGRRGRASVVRGRQRPRRRR
jgi:hypothetical protein